jgi:hypothetical protein
MVALILSNNKTCVKIKSITTTAFKYVSNLAGTDCELPEDDAVVLKHVWAV